MVREGVALCLAQFSDHLPQSSLVYHATILPVVFRFLEDVDPFVKEKRCVCLCVCLCVLACLLFVGFLGGMGSKVATLPSFSWPAASCWTASVRTWSQST